MKKLIIVALILLSKSWTTNAQDANGLSTNNAAAKNIISENNNQPAVHFSLFTKNELLKFNKPGDPGEKTDYLQKSRNQKTGAWILLGTGIAAMVTGIIVESTNSIENVYSAFADEPRNHTGTIIAIAGGCMMVGSVPLFVASSRNKTKANLSISSPKTGFGVPKNVGKSITGITMTIPLGK